MFLEDIHHMHSLLQDVIIHEIAFPGLASLEQHPCLLAAIWGAQPSIVIDTKSATIRETPLPFAYGMAPSYPCGPIIFCTSHLHNMWTCHDATPQSYTHAEVHQGPYLPTVKVLVPVSPMLGEIFLVSKS